MKRILPFLPLAVVPLVSGCKEKAPDYTRPNVVLIYADDLGFGDVSCNGSQTISTPNVDRLAERGIRFTNARSTASTSTPSRYSLLTGEYPWRREGTGIASGDAAMIIRPESYTLADMFRDAGYNTAVVGKWHLGLGDEAGKQDWNGLVSPNPSDIGFDYSYIMAATADRVPCVFMENGRVVGLDPADPIQVSYTANFPGEPTGRNNPELLRIHPSHGHDQSIVNGISRIGYMKGGHAARWKDENIADSITARSIRFLENQKEGEPFFLYFATNDIHVPRDPHSRFVGRSGMGPRGDAILSLDWSVGEIVSALERLGLDKNTIILFSSDNGPVLDDGYKDQAVELLGDHRPGGKFRGGKYSIFEAGTRVPCILVWDGRVTPGVSDELMCQMDWFASFASLMGIELPQGTAPDSYNKLDSWLDASKTGRDNVVVQNVNNNLAIITPIWKFIPASQGPAVNKDTGIELGNSPQDQLFRLLVDPEESYNYAEYTAGMVTELSQKLNIIVGDRGAGAFTNYDEWGKK